MPGGTLRVKRSYRASESQSLSSNTEARNRLTITPSAGESSGYYLQEVKFVQTQFQGGIY